MLALMAGSIATAANAAPYKADAKLFPAKAKRYGAHLTERYLRLWLKVPDAGANLVISGAPRTKVAESADRLHLWLHPPTVEQEPTTTTASSPASVSAPTTSVPPPSGGSGCVGMEAESGSLGYAEPGGDGYVGCYQISEDHYSAGGSCAGLGTDPAGQDACAAIICQTEGAGAWTNPVGENPCGRLGG